MGLPSLMVSTGERGLVPLSPLLTILNVSGHRKQRSARPGPRHRPLSKALDGQLLTAEKRENASPAVCWILSSHPAGEGRASFPEEMLFN